MKVQTNNIIFDILCTTWPPFTSVQKNAVRQDGRTEENDHLHRCGGDDSVDRLQRKQEDQTED